jgi:DNA-binding GntR family transcriptional regulator
MARRSEPRPELNLNYSGLKSSGLKSSGLRNASPGNSSNHALGNRTDGVFETLKEAILTQAIAPGTPLIEAHLAEEFGLSKTPVREALLRLSKENLVDLENTRGASVHRLTPEEIRDIFEMRLHLEPLGLERGARFLAQRELQALEKLLLDAEKAMARKDFAKLSRLNIAFHRGLYAHAPNRLLVQCLDGLNDRRRLLSLQGWQRENRSQQEWQEHRTILESVRAGQIKLARKQLVEHIKGFSRLIEKHLAQV